MIKYNEIKLVYTCPAAPPDGIYMDRTYTIGKDNKGFFFTDGNYIEYVKENDLWYIKMLFIPQDKKISWNDVDFKDEVKEFKSIIAKVEEVKK